MRSEADGFRAHFVVLAVVLLGAGVAKVTHAEDGTCGGGGGAASDGDSGMCAFPGTGAEPADAANSAPPAAAADRGASLVLHGSPMSSCTRRVLLTMLEKGLTDFELKMVNLNKGEQKDTKHLALQPFGQIPALTDGKLTLFESRAISRYIAEKYEGQGEPLLGTTPEERALVNVWFEVESQEFNPHAAVIAFEMVIGARYGRKPDREKADEAAKKLAETLDVYEERLEQVAWLAGERVTLADLSHLPLLAHLWPAGFSDLVEDRPNVNEWWERLSTRASWRRILDGIP